MFREGSNHCMPATVVLEQFPENGCYKAGKRQIKVLESVTINLALQTERVTFWNFKHNQQEMLHSSPILNSEGNLCHAKMHQNSFKSARLQITTRKMMEMAKCSHKPTQYKSSDIKNTKTKV